MNLSCGSFPQAAAGAVQRQETLPTASACFGMVFPVNFAVFLACWKLPLVTGKRLNSLLALDTEIPTAKVG